MPTPRELVRRLADLEARTRAGLVPVDICIRYIDADTADVTVAEAYTALVSGAVLADVLARGPVDLPALLPAEDDAG